VAARMLERIGDIGGISLVREGARANIVGGASDRTDVDVVQADRQTRSRLCHSKGVMSRDRKSTRLNSSHLVISYAVFCLNKKISLRIARASFAAQRSVRLSILSCGPRLGPSPGRNLVPLLHQPL